MENKLVKLTAYIIGAAIGLGYAVVIICFIEAVKL